MGEGVSNVRPAMERKGSEARIVLPDIISTLLMYPRKFTDRRVHRLNFSNNIRIFLNTRVVVVRLNPQTVFVDLFLIMVRMAP